MNLLLRSPSQIVNPLDSRRRFGFGSGVGGAAAPLPPVAGPIIWLDANQETFANNDPVGQFTDRSGNGNHFTSSGTARPTFRTARINGRPSVLADGVDDGLLLASLGAQSAWTIMFAGCLASYTSGSPCIVAVDDYAPDGTFYLFQQSTSSVANVNASMGAVNQVGSTVGAVKAFLVNGNSTASTIRASDNTTGTTSANYSRVSGPMRLFRRGDGFYSNYEIAELFMWPSVLSSSDRSTVWSYFNTRYGTAIPATP